MEQNNLPPVWVFIGAGVVVLGALAFSLSSFVMAGARATGAVTPLPPATQPPAPAAAEPVAQTPNATPAPTSTPPAEVAAPIPTMVPPQVPQVASDFTLERAKGEPLALSEQLTHGPVVLVLMQSGGG
jgi:hypothetical protein